MLTIYTASLSRYRSVKKRNVPLIDITVKSGIATFAPEPSVLWAYKRGEVSDDLYTQLYLERLKQQCRTSHEVFESFLLNEGEVCVACYCAHGKFCHRHIFVPFMIDLAEDNGYLLRYGGEIL